MNSKNIRNIIPIAIPFAMLIALFALRGTLIQEGAESMSSMQNQKEAEHMADSIRLLYDYSTNGQTGIKYTFIEFGAEGCISCRKMENVLKDIKKEFAGQVQVRFINVSQKEALEWTKYFGISAIPTQIVLNHTGHEIFRHTGYISAEDLGKIFR